MDTVGQTREWGRTGALLAACASVALATSCGKKDEAKSSDEPPPPAETTAPPIPETPPAPRATLAKDDTSATGAASWAIGMGDLGRDEPRAVALTADGGAVVAGIFSDSVTFGSKRLEAQALDVFVVKLSADGKVEWATGIGGGGEDIAADVAVDGKGNVVVVGWFSGEMVVGQSKLMAAGGDDLFVIKLDAGGTPAWARQFGGDHTDVAWAVDTDATGDVVVVGEFRNTVNFGGKPLESAGNSDIFLLRLGEDGTHKWSRSFGDIGQDYGRNVAVDSRGDIVMAAEFSVEVDFGNGTPLVHKGNRDIAVAKYDANGNYRWARAYGNTFDDIVISLALDPADNIIIGGAFEETITIGHSKLVSKGRKDALVAKLDPDGKALWALAWGASRDDQAVAVAADSFGNVLASGWFVDKVDFGGGALEALNGNQDAFLTKVDRDGTFIWAKRFGDRDHDRGRALAVAPTGESTLAGIYRFTLELADQTLKSKHKKGAKIAPADIFVARFAP